MDEENGVDLSQFSYVDTMVTVVDALNFFKDFGSPEKLMDRDLTDIEGDYRTIVNLLTDQVEFANVIILNKADLVTPETLTVLESTLHKLNPSAKIIHSKFGKVNPKEILDTKLFDFEEAEQSAGWIEELNKEEHTPETEEYGIGSFVYRSRKPFDPVRFWNYVQQRFPSTIIRSKGLFWMASRPDQAIVWSQAGGSLRADDAGTWWSAMPFSQRSQYAAFIDNQQEIEANWDTKFGDRKNELVFIGQEMNKAEIIEQLDHCLSTDEELSRSDWTVGYEDEWPISSF